MWTVPSHGSLFTGLPTSSHGAKVGWLWLDDHYQTLAETFGAAGYATYAWSSNPYLSEQTNLLQGFSEVGYAWRDPDAAVCASLTHGKLLPDDRSVEIAPKWTPSGHGQGWPERLTAYKDCGPHIVDRFLGWVDGHHDRPVLAYLNFLEAHHPRVPSLEARQAVADADRIARSLDTDASLFRIMSAMEGKASFDDDELASMRATYDATLWDLDHALAALVAGLKQRGMLDDTVLVVTSDHGENLGEHGMFDHRWDLHQTLVHVPLVIRYPAKVKAGWVDPPVSTAGLYGTLLDLAGLREPALGYALPRIGGDGPVVSELEAPTPRLAEIRSAYPDLDPNRWKLRYQALFEGPWKLLRRSDQSQALYDLDHDPDERLDLGSTETERAGRMRDALIRWDQARPKYDPKARIATDRPGNPLKADPTVDDQLRQLGYTAPDQEPK
jgi:arylsulfatase A-like enzyme